MAAALPQLFITRGSVASDQELVSRVAQRFAERVAFEFDSPEALKIYLREHPQADRSKHTVSKPIPARPKKDDEGHKKEKAPARSEPAKSKSKPLKKPKEAARVGIPGKKVMPPPNLPKLSGLKEDEREVEARLNDVVEQDPEGIADAFYDVAKANKWVFETDGAKALMPEWTRPDLPEDEKGKIHPERSKFRAKYNTVLHQGANAIAKRGFLRRLDDIAKLPEDKRTILVTSGGVAAGKGSALAARPDLAESVSATWDAAGEQNATENEWVLEEAIKRGIRPTYLFVYADPKQAWAGALERAKSIGRTVDEQLFADSHDLGAKNFKEFYDKHKDDIDFVFARAGGKGKPAEILDDMPEEALKLDADDIYEHISKYTDEKKDDLPEHIYEGATIGRRIWGA